MRYTEFENILSTPRISRYANAMNLDKMKTMLLYRYNIKASQKVYGVMSLFEVALRNAINEHFQQHFGQQDWLYQQCRNNGAFAGLRTASIVHKEKRKLRNRYTHDRLVAEMSFGFWTTLFDRPQFRAGGQNIHRIFPNRMHGTGQQTINSELDLIRKFRNRVAHLEPLCFNQHHQKDITYLQNRYDLIIKYTQWLGINARSYYYGPDHMQDTIDKINQL